MSDRWENQRMDFCRRTLNDLLDGGRRQGRDPTLRPGTKPAHAPAEA